MAKISRTVETKKVIFKALQGEAVLHEVIVAGKFNENDEIGNFVKNVWDKKTPWVFDTVTQAKIYEMELDDFIKHATVLGDEETKKRMEQIEKQRAERAKGETTQA